MTNRSVVVSSGRLQVCIAEDRVSCEPAVQILIESLLRHNNRISITVFLSAASEAFIQWASRFPPSAVFIRTLSIDGVSGWNIKPHLLLLMLSEGHEEVVWVDSDIIVTDDIARVFAGTAPDVLVATEEALWAGRDQGKRCRLWDMQPARHFGFCLNTAVLRVTRLHIPLLERWRAMLDDERYRAAQARPWNERMLHMVSDQDVLTALLCSREWGSLPVRVLHRGKEIIQAFGLYGFTTMERIYCLARGLPVFIHSQGGTKPFLPHARRPGIRGAVEAAYLDVSPYTLAVLHHHPAHADAWTMPTTIGGRVLRGLGFGSISLAGLPIALAVDCVRGMLSLTRR